MNASLGMVFSLVICAIVGGEGGAGLKRDREEEGAWGAGQG
eukprot:CAMPEP_0118854708 /NCGR_PEP_ID=MMETSP1163-20130328/2799_1 /TAXON_ID=124430 /ORGANISM="Phaeomonas parva, Strain CCMP2877" /LENGTH=40 /DNA_ID= /DNA_START= /DNA_END= /DNA_ORIENTATION=